MNRFKSIVNSSVTTWILIVFIVLALGCYLLTNDSILQFLFEGNPTKTKADILTIYMGVIGGLGVFYGFYINNKKLEEQNTQNRIAEQNKNDKRFTDAINFLKDDNPGVVLSGVNTLFQIAQQDIYYRQTVAILFCDFLSVNPIYLRDSRIDKVVLDYLFNSYLFKPEHLILKDVDFFKLPANPKSIVGFKQLSFYNCHSIMMLKTENVDTINIENCTIHSFYISDTLNVDIQNSEISSMGVISSEEKFNNIFLFNNKFNHFSINAQKGIKDLSIVENVIRGNADVRSFIINKKMIHNNEGIIKEHQIKK